MLKTLNIPVKIAVYVLFVFGYIQLTGLFPEATDLITAFKWDDAVKSGSFFFILGSFATWFLNGLFPDIWKHRYVHLSWKNPLPGSRAFSGLVNDDARFDVSDFEEVYGPLPVDPREQNKLFYSIYTGVQDRKPVQNTHRLYLLFRDLSFETLILSFIGSAVAIVFGAEIKAVTAVFIIGLMASLVFGAVARNHSHRFIANALAAATRERLDG